MKGTRWIEPETGRYIHAVRGRPITDSVAKKMGLVPSVTSVIDIFEDVFLGKWKREQIINTAQQNPNMDLEDVVELSFKNARSAASLGTQYHEAIRSIIKVIENITTLDDFEKCANMKWMEDIFPDVPRQFYSTLYSWYHKQALKSSGMEISFKDCQSHGYSGTCDYFGLRGKGHVVLDWKTQGRKSHSVRYYSKWAVQLAAYANLISVSEKIPLSDIEIVSVVIPTDREDKIYSKTWTDTAYWFGLFQHIYEIWCSPLHMNYDPRKR